MIATVDRRSRNGERDHALLLFLYNTGARVSEALALRACDLQSPPDARALHNMPEAAGGLRRRGPTMAGTRKASVGVHRGAQAMHLALRRPAHGEPDARVFHRLFEAADRVKARTSLTEVRATYR